MIISHKHRYLFIETPRTGTTSIGNELVKNYGGERILNKHSTHFEFVKSASSEELRYLKFAGVRNPLDSLVSFFHKTFNDEHVRKENTKNFQKKMRRQKTLTMKLVSIFYKLQSDYMNEKDVDFSNFFNKFYILPYTNPIDINFSFFDKILRFENLQEDFSSCLKIIGLDEIRPLPFTNVTKKPKKLFWDYFNPDIRRKAVRIFGPFMKRFKYDFPEDWDFEISPVDSFNYRQSKKIKLLFYRSRYLF